MIPAGPGLYLSDSYPNGFAPGTSTRWRGGAKYLGDALDGLVDNGSVRVAQISLRSPMPDFGTIVNHVGGTGLRCSTTSSLSGFQDLLNPSFNPGIITATGGQAEHQSETAGRFLYRLSPLGNSGGFPWPGETIGTTDYLFGDNGFDGECLTQDAFLWIGSQ